MSEKNIVIIIGAGVAGLSAALHLAERGLQPLVLEADPWHAGGRLAGGSEIEINGWRFRAEHGVHGIWSPYRNFQAMLARRAIRPVFVPAREETWFYQRGGHLQSAPVGEAIRHSWIPAPFHYLNLFLHPHFLAALDVRDWLALFQVWYGLILAVGIDPFREDQPMPGLWLGDLVKNWSPALRAFFIGLARNGLTARAEEIPLSGFIAFLRFYTLLRRDAWAFSYLPADGGTSVIEPLVGQVEMLGGRVVLGRRITRLEQLPEGWRVCWQAGETSGADEAAHLILATDAANAAAVLNASPGLETADPHWPRSMATAVVRFWFQRAPRPGPEAGIFSGDFMLDNFFWLDRIQDQYRRWHAATGGSALEAHIYGPPEVLDKPDAILLALARNDVLRAFPELGGGVLREVLQRNLPTHTLFDLGPADKHLGIQTRWPNLYCCGDWVRHPAPSFFLERACVTGIEAANAVLRACGRPLWPLLEYLPPEPFVGFLERLMQSGRRALRRKK